MRFMRIGLCNSMNAPPAAIASAGGLKNTGKGNLFVIFGEPDITILPEKGGRSG